MDRHIKATFEFNNSEINAASLNHAFNWCAREIAKIYIEEYHTEKIVNLTTFANHIKGDIIFDIWNTASTECTLTDPDDIEYWNALKEQGRSKVYSTYNF